MKTRFVLISLVAIIMSLIIVFVVRQGNFYPSGFAGLSLALNKLIGKIWVFPLFMACFNLPLAVFSYFKMGSRFAALTFVFVIVYTGSYFLFSSLIPINISLFKIELLQNETGTRAIAAVISGTIYGIVMSFTYMLKGCAGGVDYLSMYYATKKKSFAIYNMIISGVSMILIVFLAVFLKDGINKGIWSFYNIFNNTLFLTVLFIGISSIAAHYSYPRYIKVAVKIFTNKGYKISRSLINRNYPHKHTVTIVKSPTSNKTKTEIYIVVYYHQYVNLLNRINNIDENAFVTVTKLAQVRGYLSPPKLN